MQFYTEILQYLRTYEERRRTDVDVKQESLDFFDLSGVVPGEIIDLTGDDTPPPEEQIPLEHPRRQSVLDSIGTGQRSPPLPQAHVNDMPHTSPGGHSLPLPRRTTQKRTGDELSTDATDKRPAKRRHFEESTPVAGPSRV